MKRTCLMFGVLMLLTGFLTAADTSSFVNLGFSSDEKNFAFGTYVGLASGHTQAGLYLVDLVRNDYIPRGVFQRTSPQATPLGQDGQSTLLKLLMDQKQAIDLHRIEPELSGRPIYILLNGEKQEDGLEFQDFETGKLYRIRVNQEAVANGAGFWIDLQITEKGATRQYAIGQKGLIRPGVKTYRIRQVILSPKGSALVFVMEMLMDGKSGFATGHMVETLAL